MKTCLATILAAAMVGCGGNQSHPMEKQIEIFDVVAVIDGEAKQTVNDIAESVEFIPLDKSVDDALLEGISGLEESETGFYVRDGFERPVKFFDRKGSFVTTKGSIGRGPNEYLGVMRHAVDWAEDNLYLMPETVQNYGLMAFDASGRMFVGLDGVLRADIAFFNNGLVAMMNDTGMGDSIILIRTFSPDLRLTGELKSVYRGANRLRATTSVGGEMHTILPVVLSNNGRELAIKEPRNDTVYHWVGGRLAPQYVLRLGKYFPDASLFGSVQSLNINIFDKEALQTFWREYDWVTDIFEGERQLVIGLRDRAVVFDRAGTEGFLLTMTVDGMPFIPCYVRDNRLVGYVDALDAAGTIEGVKEDDNPVIVVAKLK